MQLKELQDKAYLIATGNCMLEYYNYDEFQALEEAPTGPDAWEPFEHWSSDMIINHVAQVADSIIRDFRELVKE